MIWPCSCIPIRRDAVRVPKALLTGRFGIRVASISLQLGTLLPQQATARVRSSQESTIAKLAKFFPSATPVRIPVQLTRMAESTAFSESTVIEFGTPREVLFASALPLEFGDKLRVQNSDGTLDAEACVVAVQYNAGRTAVAARFVREVPNWIVKS